MDRQHFIGAIHRASHEARELGARYAAADAAATGELSGVRLNPARAAAVAAGQAEPRDGSDPAAAAARSEASDAAHDLITPVGVYREPAELRG